MLSRSKKLPPGSVIGIIGGGQLGRMLSQAAKNLEYKTVILDPIPLCPAGQVSDHQIVANYNSISAAKSLSNMCDVVTYEFENVDLNCLMKISENIDVFPSPEILRISSNRILEKEMNFIPCLTSPGDVILFDCFIPHRSKANFSMNQRRNMYLTYNKKSEGDKRMNYYTRKEKEMPPDDRRSNNDFKDSPIHMAFYKT